MTHFISHGHLGDPYDQKHLTQRPCGTVWTIRTRSKNSTLMKFTFYNNEHVQCDSAE